MPYSPNTGLSACQLAASATDDSANIHVDMMSHTLYHRHNIAHNTTHYFTQVLYTFSHDVIVNTPRALECPKFMKASS